MDVAGDANAARSGERLKALRDIDAIAKEIAPLDDHIADIDADTKRHAIRVRRHLVERSDRILHLHRGSQRIDGAWKFGDHAVAGSAEHAAAMLGHRLANEFAPGIERR